jgi:hypothetical protein
MFDIVSSNKAALKTLPNNVYYLDQKCRPLSPPLATLLPLWFKLKIKKTSVIQMEKIKNVFFKNNE